MASEFDQILDDLESRWNHSTEVELAAFLSEHGIVGQNQDSPPETIRLLLEAVQVDLERRWMSRGRLRIPEIAQYLEQFPSLNTAEARSHLEAFDRSLRQRGPQSELNDTPQLARTSLALGEPPDEEFGPRRSDFSDGQKFGPYRIVRKIGEGGMGAVYQAVQEHLGKSVAIKVLSPKLVHDDDVVARFRREMKAAGQIEHPHVVRAMDAGEIEGTHYLVTEFVDGTDLSKLVQTHGPVSVRDACHIIQQAAEALSAAHAQGFIHRDIKPSNLMLTAGGQVKLLDLGLTRLVSDNESLTTELTEAGNTFGTPDYMAPEQWEDARDADPRTDLYALGCTLFFLLIGRAPFATDRYRSAYSKMKAHADAEIPDAASLREDIPVELAAVIHKLLAKRREDRFQTAAELSLAIATIEAGLFNNTEPQIAQSAHAGTPVARSLRKLAAFSLSAIGLCVIVGFMIRSVLDKGNSDDALSRKVSSADTRNSKPKPALTFDGVGDFVELAGLEELSAPLTVEAWIELEQSNKGHFFFSGAPLWMTLEVHGEHWMMSVLGPNRLVSIVRSNSPVELGKRVHVAGCWDGKQVTLFVDGKRMTGNAQANWFNWLPIRKTYIGRNTTEGSPGVVGRVYGMRISKTIRYTGQFDPTNVWPIDSDTVALYRCDEGAGDVLRDSSDGNYHGKIVGATWGGKVSKTKQNSSRTTDPHRAAAEWVLSLQSPGSRWVQIALENDPKLTHTKSIKPGEILPDEPFRVLAVYVQSPLVTNADVIRFIAPVSELLNDLRVTSPNVTSASLPTIKRLSKLYYIGLNGTKLSGADCKEVIASLPMLHGIEISSEQLTPELADFLRDTKRIIKVGLYGGSDEQLRQLMTATQLTQLMFVGGSTAESATWRELPDKLSNLTYMDLQTSNVTDDDLAVFSRFPKLDHLSLAATKITDAGVVALGNCPALTSLSVNETKVTKSGVWWFHEQCPNCRISWDGGVIEPKATTNAAQQTLPPETKPVAHAAAASVLEFDGLDDRVDIPAFKFDWSKPFTWEAIVEPLPDKVRLSEDKSAFADPLFRHTNQDLSGFNILLDRVASHWFLIHRPSVGSPYNYYSVPCRSTSTPCHLAVVFTGQELSLYEDGKKQPLKHLSQLKGAADSQQVDLKTYSNSSGSLGQDIYYAKNISRWFRGRFRHLQLSEGARDPKSFTQELGDTVANSTTALLYQFERRDGEQLRDLSPHQRHGWIRGARWVSRPTESNETPSASDNAPPTMAPTFESTRVRQLVHSVVSAGGRVEIQFDSQHGSVLVNRDNLAELPERPFLVRTIVLADATQWPEQQQELLGDVSYLDWVRLDQTSTAMLEILSKMALKGAFVIGSDPELRILRNRGIQELSLMGNLGDETAWNQLAELPRLDRLLIGAAGRPSTQVLSLCPSLRNLTLSFPEPVPDDLLETLASLPQLTELRIEGAVDDRLLRVVEPLKRLKVLDVSAASKVTEDGLRKLVAARPDLIVLHPTLRATEADLATMKFIEEARGSLQVSTSNGQPWQAPSSEPFVPRELHFQGGRLTDFAQVLSNLRFLIAVRCPSTGNPDELAKLFKRQPNLRFITLEARGMTADGLRELAAQPELLQIYMHSSPKLSGEEWNPIANCRRLRSVVLLDGSEINDDALAQLACCEQLDTLVIQNSPHLTPSGLLPLKSLPWLVELNLARCSLDDSAVDNLAQLQLLRVLHLDGTRVTQSGIDRLRAALPKCAIFWKGSVLLPAKKHDP